MIIWKINAFQQQLCEKQTILLDRCCNYCKRKRWVFAWLPLDPKLPPCFFGALYESLVTLAMARFPYGHLCKPYNLCWLRMKCTADGYRFGDSCQANSLDQSLIETSCFWGLLARKLQSTVTNSSAMAQDRLISLKARTAHRQCSVMLAREEPITVCNWPSPPCRPLSLCFWQFRWSASSASARYRPMQSLQGYNNGPNQKRPEVCQYQTQSGCLIMRRHTFMGNRTWRNGLQNVVQSLGR